MNIDVKCPCGHTDDFMAFATPTDGVWKCPVCREVKDAREAYKDEEFLDIMAKRAEVRQT